MSSAVGRQYFQPPISSGLRRGNIMSAIRNALAGDAGWHVCVQCADR